MNQEELLVEFDKTTFELLQLLAALSEENLNVVPFAGSWTAGQVGEHLVNAYGVVDCFDGNTKPAGRDAGKNVERVKTMFLDFNKKLKSPEKVAPETNTFVKKDRLLTGLNRRIMQFRQCIEKKDLTVLCPDFVIPELGEFTRLEWICFSIFHTQRHIHQLKKIIEVLKEKS